MIEDGNAVRVVIAADHLIAREGLRLIFETDPLIELVGEACDGASVVRVVEDVQPDVVLMDIRMPGLDGLQAMEQVLNRWPDIAVIILTTYSEDSLMIRGLRAGARGYLLKDTSRAMLLHAIHSAARGQILLQSEVMTRLLAYAESSDSASRKERHRSTIDGVNLSAREQEVLRRVAQGERSKEIAGHLGITERTVKTYLSNIYTKLGVDSRASAITKAIETGVLILPEDGSFRLR